MTSPLVLDVAHSGLTVTDLDDAVTLWCSGLGFTLERTFTLDAHTTAATTGVHGATIRAATVTLGDHRVESPLDPKNANRYAYAASDPINGSDPSGRAFVGPSVSGCVVFVCGNFGFNFNDKGIGITYGYGFGIGGGLTGTLEAGPGGNSTGGSTAANCSIANGGGVSVSGSQSDSGDTSVSGGPASGAGASCTVGRQYQQQVFTL